MTDERLIADVTQAIRDADNNFEHAVGSSPEAEDRRWLGLMARAAVSVFQKAHTPTDDEREVLSTVVAIVWRDSYGTPTDHDFADAILAAGFRRSEVPERIADDGRDEEMPCSECGSRNPVWWAVSGAWNLAVGGDASREAGGMLCPTCFHRRWLTATEPREGADSPHERKRQARAKIDRLLASGPAHPEPQGDPSDAEIIQGLRDQIEEARTAWWSATEQGDNGLVYTEKIDDAMDNIWSAIGHADWMPEVGGEGR